MAEPLRAMANMIAVSVDKKAKATTIVRPSFLWTLAS